MMRKIFLAADHGGFDLKEKIKRELILLSNELHIEIEDLGTHGTESVDYPDYASALCQRVHGLQALASPETPPSQISLPVQAGILVCGSGQGMAIRANKYSHIRAALCWNEESTKLSREHNDANVLCLGGRLLDHDLALEMVRIFLTTHFAGGRHQARVLKISAPTSV